MVKFLFIFYWNLKFMVRICINCVIFTKEFVLIFFLGHIVGGGVGFGGGGRCAWGSIPTLTSSLLEFVLIVKSVFSLDRVA